MTTEAKPPEKKVEEKVEEPKFDASEYSCEILLEKTTVESSRDKKFPTDAFNVTYSVEGTDYLDVTRSSKKSNIFDMYYDRYGNVKKIDYGYGSVNPSQWGYKKPEKRKKRK